MAKAFADLTASGQAKDIPHADWLALLLDRETSWRRDKRLTAAARRKTAPAGERRGRRLSRRPRSGPRPVPEALHFPAALLTNTTHSYVNAVPPECRNFRSEASAG